MTDGLAERLLGLYPSPMAQADATTSHLPPGGPSGRLWFDAVLHPHRSLGPRGRFWLIAGVGAASSAFGILFWALGAWPVFGFLGLDVILLYLCLRASTRAGEARETIRLGRETLVIHHVTARGAEHRIELQPYWLRVAVEEHPSGDCQVVLTSHGTKVVVGSFLSPDERRDLGAALQRALNAWRRAPWSNDQ